MSNLQLIELCLSPSSKVSDIVDNIEGILHDPQLPIPPDIIIPRYLEDLHSVNEESQIAAARALGELGIVDPTVVMALVQALHDSNTWVRRYSGNYRPESS